MKLLSDLKCLEDKGGRFTAVIKLFQICYMHEKVCPKGYNFLSLKYTCLVSFLLSRLVIWTEVK
jgi:hypothetical protein